jgi:hypothetical protein
MLTLLERLASSPAGLPLHSLDAGYGCLAWPFGHGALHDKTDDLPIKARMAIESFLAESGGAVDSPEAARLHRLREVLPAAEWEVAEPAPVSSSGNRLAAPVDTVFAPVAAGSAAQASVSNMPGARIARSCPFCGANNISTNHACIACGKVLTATAK